MTFVGFNSINSINTILNTFSYPTEFGKNAAAVKGTLAVAGLLLLLLLLLFTNRTAVVGTAYLIHLA